MKALLRNPVVWLLLLAAGMRAALWKPGFGPDSRRFYYQAHGLLAGEGFRDETSLPPGYPVFLAGVFLISDSPAFVRVLHFFMSLGTCYLVYAAILPRSKKAGLMALTFLATSPLIAQHVAYVRSETFAEFLSALLVQQIARLNIKGPTLAAGFVIGVLSVGLLLTAPATIFLAFLLWCYAAYLCRSSWLGLFGLVAGGIVIMAPWQVHCLSAGGRLQPTVFSRGRVLESGFSLWTRTWAWRSIDTTVHWDPTYFQKLPDWVFSSPAERSELTALHIKGFRLHRESEHPWWNHWEDPEVDRGFRRAAEARILADPWGFYLRYPLKRAAALWFPWDYAWEKSVNLADTIMSGGNSVLRRATATLLGTLGVIAYNAVSVALVAMAVWAVFHPKAVPWLILASVVLYTAISASWASVEWRRNLPFYPAIFFMLFYFVRSTPSAIAISRIWMPSVTTQTSCGTTDSNHRPTPDGR